MSVAVWVAVWVAVLVAVLVAVRVAVRAHPSVVLSGRLWVVDSVAVTAETSAGERAASLVDQTAMMVLLTERRSPLVLMMTGSL